MPFAILAKPLLSLFTDAGLRLRLAMQRWKALDRGWRNRVELGAVVSLLPLSAALAALAAAPSAVELDALRSQPVIESIAAPPIADQVAELVRQEDSFVREDRVQRGETLAALLERLGIADAAAAAFIRTDPSARPLARIAPGRFVQANINAQGRLNWLKVFSGGEFEGETATTRVLTVDRSGEEWGFRVAESELVLERRIELKSGSVRLTLFGAADMPAFRIRLQQMVDALRRRRFTTICAAAVRSCRLRSAVRWQYLHPGRLLAVDFTNAGSRRSAYWFGDGSKRGGFTISTEHKARVAPLAARYAHQLGVQFDRTHPVFGMTPRTWCELFSALGTRIHSVSDGVMFRRLAQVRQRGRIRMMESTQRSTRI
jgi:hypothetical protein